MSEAIITESIRIPVALNPVARTLSEGYDPQTLTFEFTQPNSMVMRAAMVEAEMTNSRPARWSE